MKTFNILSYQRKAHQNYERYHLTFVRIAIIKKSTNNKCWRGCAEKGTLLHCWWECKLVQPLWKTVWRFLKKVKIELPYDPDICPGVGLQDHMVTLFLVFKGTFIPFSMVAAPIYIPTNSVGGFLFSTPPPVFIIYRLFNDGDSDT